MVTRFHTLKSTAPFADSVTTVLGDSGHETYVLRRKRRKKPKNFMQAKRKKKAVED